MEIPPLTAVLDKNAIQMLIPHGGAMNLLHAVTRWDGDGIDCLALSHRDSDNPLRRDGWLPVQAGIEYAAQAMALHGALTEPKPLPRNGYLATLTDVRWSVQCLDDGASELAVQARRQSVSEGGACYEFSLRSEGRELLAGTAVIAFGSTTGAA